MPTLTPSMRAEAEKIAACGPDLGPVQGAHLAVMEPISNAMRDELQALADQIKARNAAFRAAFPQVFPREVMGPFRPTYARGVSAYSGCGLCGGTPDGESHRGYVGTCNCPGGRS